MEPTNEMKWKKAAKSRRWTPKYHVIESAGGFLVVSDASGIRRTELETGLVTYLLAPVHLIVHVGATASLLIGEQPWRHLQEWHEMARLNVEHHRTHEIHGGRQFEKKARWKEGLFVFLQNLVRWDHVCGGVPGWLCLLSIDSRFWLRSWS